MIENKLKILRSKKFRWSKMLISLIWVQNKSYSYYNPQGISTFNLIIVVST